MSAAHISGVVLRGYWVIMHDNFMAKTHLTQKAVFRGQEWLYWSLAGSQAMQESLGLIHNFNLNLGLGELSWNNRYKYLDL